MYSTSSSADRELELEPFNLAEKAPQSVALPKNRRGQIGRARLRRAVLLVQDFAWNRFN